MTGAGQERGCLPCTNCIATPPSTTTETDRTSTASPRTVVAESMPDDTGSTEEFFVQPSLYERLRDDMKAIPLKMDIWYGNGSPLEIITSRMRLEPGTLELPLTTSRGYLGTSPGITPTDFC